MSTPPKTFTLFRRYLDEFLGYAGVRAVKGALLLTASGFMQGISLLMIIPLLGLTGFVSAEPQGSSEIAGTLEGLFSSINLSYNLVTVLGLFFLILTADALFTRYRSITMFNLQVDFINHLRNNLYRNIGNASWKFHSRHHSAESLHLLDEAVSNIGSGTYSVLQLFVLAFQAAVYVIVSVQISLTMTVLMIVTGLVLYLSVMPINRRMFRHGEKAVTSSKKLYRTMSDYFGGLKLAKSYNRTSEHVHDFAVTAHELRNEQMQLNRSSSSAQMWMRIFTVGLLCVFVYVALTAAHMGGDQLILLIVLANRLYGVLSSGQSHWQRLLEMLPNYATFTEAREKFQAHAEPRVDMNAEPLQLHQQIRLEDVSFQYLESTDRPALTKISISIPAKKTTAIIGPSGAGKSTLADILMGVLIPDSGQIIIDDKPLTTKMLAVWRDSVAYVPQEVYLFDGSIRSNLNWACGQALEDDALWTALDAAAAGDFVRKLPDGLDSVVGERGVRLSGGERQRIALARALVTQPDALILDEATSSLDQQNERRIRDAIMNLRGQLTIIIIAHRHSTIEHADHVISMDHGKVAASGNWEELHAIQ